MARETQPHWRNIAFVLASPFASVIGAWLYIDAHGFHLTDVLCLLVMTALTGLAITAGYHRYYSHRTYECHRVVQIFYLLFGAAALQAPVLKWVRDHRDHHRFVDREGDPYNVSKGIVWAHVGWTFVKNEKTEEIQRTPDLVDDWLVVLQYRYFALLGLVVGLGFPFLIGLLLDRPLGGVLWGGLVRTVLAHHCTFLINSVGHRFGRQPYSSLNSSRDNPVLAFLTMGEGYHNFHHAFPRDFRNGIRWYDWDPTKWLIAGLAGLGLASNLRTTPKSRIDLALIDTSIETERA